MAQTICRQRIWGEKMGINIDAAALQQALSLKVLAGKQQLHRQISDCYIGDLLSWVMGRAPADSVWITVMGNVNAIAVAKLADISCILLCEGAHLDEEARVQAETHHLLVLQSDQPAYPLALSIARLLE